MLRTTDIDVTQKGGRFGSTALGHPANHSCATHDYRMSRCDTFTAKQIEE